MKKALSVFLAIVISLTAFSAAFASGTECDCGVTPVIFVHGFAGETIYLDPESESPVSVFPPSGKAIVSAVPDLLMAAGAALITRNSNKFGKYAAKALDKMLGQMSCDGNGDSLYNVSIAVPPYQEDEHRTDSYQFSGSCNKPDGSGNFIFFYDWRLDPIDSAKKLHAFSQEIMDRTGHDKVSLVFHSEGNTVGAAYAALYGGENVEKFVFLSPAFQGLSLIGAAFTKDIALEGKCDELIEFLWGFLGYSSSGKFICSLVSFLDKIGIMPKIIDRLGKAFDEEYDFLYEEFLTGCFGTSPGIWTFVPDEYYAEAKQTMFGGKESEYAGLIEKIDDYHYNVQNKLVENLEKAIDDGAAIVICSGYGISSIPITGEDEWQADMLIDTKYMSIGAECAPYGETLGNGYEQADSDCGHNHLSADGIIDASTCAFPEYTWFFRGQDHNRFTSAYNEFLTWALLYDGQPTVNSNPDYPQFTENKDGALVPVTAPAENDRGGFGSVFTSLFGMIKDALAK